jgi:transcription elongation factor Elf1
MSLPILFTRPRKVNPKAVIFKTFEPTPDVMCPITQEPIATSQLEFLEDRVMSQDKPNHTGTRLACNHEFTAMCLLYHWARNGNVLCPVCRSGPKCARLNLLALPEHFRADMMRRIKNERENDREERNRENEEAARQFDNGRWFVTFLQSNPCYCVVDTTDTSGKIVPMSALLENYTCTFTGQVAGPLSHMEGTIVNHACRTRFPSFNVDYSHVGSCLTMTMNLETFRAIAGQHMTFSALMAVRRVVGDS